MKLEIKIKEEYKKHIIGFNGSGLPLGERTDLDKLAELAHSSNDASIKQVFEKLPSLEELTAAKTEKFIAATEQPAAAPAK
jgi:hypothetical protein